MSATTHPQVDLNARSLAGARAWFAHKGLSRPREGRAVAGVCAAFARRYDLNPLVTQIIAVVTVITLTPIVYGVAWLLMPSDPEAAAA
jgi:phage shock protein PspC (stress-responsive transcriptional regulator)